MFPINSAVILLIISASVFLVTTKVISDKCTTPDHETGRCILLENCPSIYNISNDFEGPMTPERLNFLVGSQCGFKGSYPKVCCPLQEINSR
ncbi:hypothetical protein GWI33_000653 [Rhynchophorus ferrugineus]|uniref:Clip domain-containing protein n=1 Tax=Rhynchophorus ferrugineus TaxID=354439 RepID=A0A834ILY2_RHYFE|nr:hypothetical protein GWI33_000653 [Rhynchophorus ferrugineus]